MPNPSSLLFIVDGKPSASYARLSMLKDVVSFDVLNVDMKFSTSYDVGSEFHWRFAQFGSDFFISPSITKIVFFPRSFEKLASFPFVGRGHRSYDQRQWRSLWNYFEYITREFACLNHPSKARIAANRLHLVSIARKASIATAWTAVMGGETPLGETVTVPKSTEIIGKTLSDTTEIGASSSAYPIAIDALKITDLANSSPILLQGRIKIDSQYRVYFFGVNFIIVKIVTTSQEIDYRFDEFSVDNYGICQNEQVSIAMSELTSILDIDFGSVDFIHDGNNLFLIDINPHGTWDWLPVAVRSLIDVAYQTFISDWSR